MNDKNIKDKKVFQTQNVVDIKHQKSINIIIKSLYNIIFKYKNNIQETQKFNSIWIFK
jgi:hypothetical protein